MAAQATPLDFLALAIFFAALCVCAAQGKARVEHEERMARIAAHQAARREARHH